MSFVVRPFAGGDEAGVLELFRECFGRPLSSAEYRWKVLEAPWHPGVPSAWVAEEEGRIIGHYAARHLRLQLGSETRPALTGCEVMTAAAHRRRGVLTALGTEAHRAWATGGIALCVDPANHAAWGRRAHALGRRDAFPLLHLVRTLAPERALARRLRLPVLSRARPLGRAFNAAFALRLGSHAGLEIEEVARAGPELDAVWESVRGERELSLLRDRAWVAWRFLAAPLPYRVLLARRAGRPAGYAAFRTREGTGQLAELVAPAGDEAARRALLRAALELLAAEGAERVAAQVLPDRPLHRTLSRAGFRLRGRYTIWMLPLAPGLDAARLMDPGRWMMSGGDFDVL